ncbi:MAG: aspartokinase/homoserine dehydrogenase 1 [Phycisphaerales bacterium]|jgi:aspartokinase/homoserine dehydrogenase 1
MPTQVHKFGGTSVKDADRITSAARLLVEAAADGTRVVGVSSAMSGVTNAILDTATKARTGDRAAADSAIAGLRQRHHEARLAIAPDDAELESQIDTLLDECLELLHGTAMLRELTPRVSDRAVVTGEKLAVRLLAAAIRKLGMASVALDADEFLRTTDAFGAADPLSHTDCPGIADSVGPHLKAGAIPVVTGFCGRSASGATTTFGRGGSDLTATLIAAALRADSCVIWTDVAGAYTADPRIVPEATPIRAMHPREAAEMSFYGARVLHPRTMIPVASLGIPVWIKSSFEPALPGTLIDAQPTGSKTPVRAVTAIREQALVSIEGKGMAGVPGIAARVFGSLAERGLSMTMISQSSSESSVCFALPEAQIDEAERALKNSLRGELADGLVEEIRIKPSVAIVAAVGMGMIHTPGVAGRALASLGKRGINILAIAQGSSELNISLAVEGADARAAVHAIHHEFFGPTRIGDRLDVAVRGFGGVGQQLARLITEYEPPAGQPSLRLVAVSDRSGVVVRPDGLSKGELAALIGAKGSGRPLSGEPGGVALASPTDLPALLPAGAPTTLADCTDDREAAAVWSAAFANEIDVATANKDPLAADDDKHAALLRDRDSHGRTLRCEATVGAALPVIDTLAMLRATGDDIFTIEGSLSGSLGFMLSEIDRGTTLSEAVKKAMDLGYTEPDPAIDLSGHDVLRKALILGRLSGLLRSKSQVTCEGLVDGSLIGASAEAFAKELETVGERLAERAAKAKQNGSVLRFIAQVKPSSATVGLREIAADSPMASLSAAESLVAFTTRRYHKHPLMIRGAGAGAEITASGVLTDLLWIARERCRIEHVAR